jgi:hypothetical protein
MIQNKSEVVILKVDVKYVGYMITNSLILRALR